jgi:hypothetical protein
MQGGSWVKSSFIKFISPFEGDMLKKMNHTPFRKEPQN